eukprot:TRINITY_DN5864_c0_g1_i1.p3 TRINITY_DN5864_c0_g1~~TRINITY_DN5864_c0_g1_i1.p3  ORF type:complete len:135 (+),score=12.06 TRINITY_DN5864_c0_g1_i1:249-653(+)
MSSPNSAVDTVNTIDGLEGLITFGQRLAGFDAMWQTIWTWNLIVFGFSHSLAGLLAAVRFRSQLNTWKTWLLPLLFVGFGLLIPATAGLITALLIAGIYTNAGLNMTTTEALAWGAGQFILYAVFAFRPNYATL